LKCACACLRDVSENNDRCDHCGNYYTTDCMSTNIAEACQTCGEQFVRYEEAFKGVLKKKDFHFKFRKSDLDKPFLSTDTAVLDFKYGKELQGTKGKLVLTSTPVKTAISLQSLSEFFHNYGQEKIYARKPNKTQEMKCEDLTYFVTKTSCFEKSKYKQ
jgi:hypothetical protein